MSWGKVGVLALVIAVGLTAYAAGAGSSSPQTVVLCAAKKGGGVTLAKHGRCGKGNKTLALAKQGPTGAVGAQGAAGATGTATLPPTEAPHLVKAATDACSAEAGSFCVTETGLCWDMANAGNGLAPVAFQKDPNGYVHLSGSFANQNGSGACGSDPRPIFYLPSGYRPTDGKRIFTVASCDEFEEIVEVFVEPNGLVSSWITGCLDLDGISFYTGA